MTLMMDFFNPNDYWRNQGYDPYKDLSDNERQTVAIVSAACIIIGAAVGFIICALV